MHVSGRETEPRYSTVRMRGSEEERKLGVIELESGCEVVSSAEDTPGDIFSSSGTDLFMRRTYVAGQMVCWV